MAKPNFDEITLDHVGIENAHHEIHAGHSFTTGSEVEVSNAGSISFLIQTPNTNKFSHVFIHTESVLEASRTIYENVSISNSGTQLASYDRNRTLQNAAGMTVFFQPTITATGSCLQHLHWGSGKKAGAEQRSENEWILNSGIGYSIVLMNETSSNNLITNWINWYEHVNEI